MTDETRKRWLFLYDSLKPQVPPSIVDIGANPLDDPPYKPLLDLGLCRVHGFEPQPEAFGKLMAMKGDLESYTNAAVGDGKEHSLNIYHGSGLSSLFDLDPDAMTFLGRAKRPARLIEKIQVKTQRLDDIEDIDHIDLLKIDVQGAEKMIFQNGAEKVSRAVAVVTELRFYPLYENEPLLDEQISVLSNMGFRLHKFLFIKNQLVANSQKDRLRPRKVSSQVLDGDAVFVRDLRDPKSVSNSQLESLALLADAVFESYDLALHCLDQLVSRGELSPEMPSKYVDLLPSELRRS
jgi:FkbM family methyltransferase